MLGLRHSHRTATAQRRLNTAASNKTACKRLDTLGCSLFQGCVTLVEHASLFWQQLLPGGEDLTHWSSDVHEGRSAEETGGELKETLSIWTVAIAVHLSPMEFIIIWGIIIQHHLFIYICMFISTHVWAGNYSYIVLYQARQWRCASARGDTLPVTCQQIIKMTLGLWLKGTQITQRFFNQSSKNVQLLSNDCSTNQH